MRKLMKATGAGLKHFFGARESISRQKNLGRKFKAADSKVDKSKILGIMGMYAVYKGSPIGLAKNIRDSIKVGKWKLSDLNARQRDVDEFLASTGLSDEGAEAISRLVRNNASDNEMFVNLSPQDAQILKEWKLNCISKPVIASTSADVNGQDKLARVFRDTRDVSSDGCGRPPVSLVLPNAESVRARLPMGIL